MPKIPHTSEIGCFENVDFQEGRGRRKSRKTKTTLISFPSSPQTEALKKKTPWFFYFFFFEDFAMLSLKKRFTWVSMFLAWRYLLKTLFLRPLLETGLPFYGVIRATPGPSRLQGRLHFYRSVRSGPVPPLEEGRGAQTAFRTVAGNRAYLQGRASTFISQLSLLVRIRESNPLPAAPQSSALPTELIQLRFKSSR